MGLNGAQVHLLLNHMPVVGMIAAMFVTLYASRFGGIEARRIALGLIVFAAATAVPTYFTGEPAEDVVKAAIPGREHAIHEHEEAAEVAFILSSITGIVALGALIALSRNVPAAKQMFLSSLAGAVITCGVMANAAHLGGHVTHREIETPTVTQSMSEAEK